MKLRPYQEEAVSETINSIKNKEGAGLLYLATGAGKTVIAAEIAKRHSDKALFLVHREELAKQTINKFKAVWPKAECGLVKAEHNDLGKHVTVASIQTLASEKRLNQLIENGPYPLIIADECFVAGTHISTECGVKNIEDIKVGDIVLSYSHEYSPEIKHSCPATEYKSVKTIWKNKLKSKYLIEIVYDDDRCYPHKRNTTLYCTPEHPLFCGHEIGYIKAENLTLNNKLFYDSEYSWFGGLSSVNILSINKIKANCKFVYNFEVEDNHNYFANGILVHNCHHSVSPTWQKVLNSLKENSYILGLTATPQRSDSVSLIDTFNRVLYKYDILRAIKEGNLVDIKGIRIDLDLNLDSIKTQNGDFQVGGLSALMTQDKVIEHTVDSWEKYASDRHTIVFCVGVEHCNKLHAEFTKRGISAAVIVGDTPSEERQHYFNQVEKGKIRVLIGCMVLTEGFDLPRIDCVLMSRPTLSSSLFIQSLGRGLRLYPGKKDCLLLDVSGNSKKHNIAKLAVLLNIKDTVETAVKGEELGPKKLPDKVESLKMLLSVDEEFSLTAASEERKYEWIDTEYGLALGLGENRHGFYVIDKDPNEFGCFRIVHYYSHNKMDKADILRDGLSLDWCITMAEDAAIDFIKKAFNDRSEGWRNEAISYKQVIKLSKMGVSIQEMPTTKGDAQNCITKININTHMKGIIPARESDKYLERLNYLKQIMNTDFWKTLNIKIKGKVDNLSINEVIRLLHHYKNEVEKGRMKESLYL